MRIKCSDTKCKHYNMNQSNGCNVRDGNDVKNCHWHKKKAMADADRKIVGIAKCGDIEGEIVEVEDWNQTATVTLPQGGPSQSLQLTEQRKKLLLDALNMKRHANRKLITFRRDSLNYTRELAHEKEVLAHVTRLDKELEEIFQMCFELERL